MITVPTVWVGRLSGFYTYLQNLLVQFLAYGKYIVEVREGDGGDGGDVDKVMIMVMVVMLIVMMVVMMVVTIRVMMMVIMMVIMVVMIPLMYTE